MSKEAISLVNGSSNLIAKTHDLFQSSPVFILCDTCYWCATYFDNTGIPRENKCPQCNANNNELSSFPIMPNESFSFIYNDKRVVELEFKARRKGN
jgi:hypothetical protein